jgi:hypothetical protein
MKLHGFPRPVERVPGKRLWSYRKVCEWLDYNEDIVGELSIAEKVRHATRKAVNG